MVLSVVQTGHICLHSHLHNGRKFIDLFQPMPHILMISHRPSDIRQPVKTSRNTSFPPTRLIYTAL